jgi:hypothetical protein
MSNQPLFQVSNHHRESCGIPPQIDEQAFPGVYQFERKTPSFRTGDMRARPCLGLGLDA